MLGILIILFIIIFIELIVIGFTFSSVVLEIKKCDISYNENGLKKFDIKDIDFVIKIYIFKILKILSIKIYKDYLEIFKIKIKYSLLRKIKKNMNLIFEDIKIIIKKREDINFKLLKPRINSLNLYLTFGTPSQVLTTFSVPTISTFLSMLLSNSITNFNLDTYNYKIVPQYLNKNYLKLNLNTKLSFNTLNLIIFLTNIKEILKTNKAIK